MKKNLIINYSKAALYNIASLFLIGGIVQIFLLENGIDAQRVSVFVSVMQVAEISSMVVFSPMFERRKDLFRLNSRFHLLLLPMLFAMIFCCVAKGTGVQTKYLLVLIGGVITYMGIGLVSFTEYKLPYKIMDMQQYGSISAVQGIIVGITSLTASAIVAKAIDGRDYNGTMLFFLILAVVLILVCSRLVLRFRELNINASMTKNADRKINLLRYKPFYLLIVPNLMRGFATGTFGLFPTIGYHLGMLDSKTATDMVTIGNVAIFATFLFYRRFAKLHKDKELLLFAGSMLLFLMPLSFAGFGRTGFLIIYAVAFIFKTILESVSPIALVPIIDYEIVSQFSAWRVSLYLLGLAVSGLVTIPMIDRFGILETMILNGVFFVICNLITYVVIRRLSDK